MALTSVDINYTVLPGTSYVITYKKSTDTTWIVPPGNPTNVSPFTINGLETEIQYDIRIQNNCGVVSTQFTPTSESTTIWIEDTFTCEQDQPFNLSDTYTGFSSPLDLLWDADKGRFYVGDADDVLGVFYWFNPDTITGFGSVTHIPGSITPDINMVKVDPQYRRIYSSGDNSGGMMVLDIASDTSTLLPYGTNTGGVGGVGRRAPIGISSDRVYCFSKTPDNFIRIYNRVDLSFISQINISSIPSSGIYLTQGFNVLFVGSEIWVTASARPNGNIARYNSDFTVLNGVITLPGIAFAFGTSQYWQASYYDVLNNKVYIGDMGSKKYFVINTTTAAIEQNIQLNNFRGKLYSVFSFTKNELDASIYMQARGVNTLSDGTPNFKLYKLDPATGLITFLYPDAQASQLALRAGTTEQWGINSGRFIWDSPNTGWDTDGLILKYT